AAVHPARTSPRTPAPAGSAASTPWRRAHRRVRAALERAAPSTRYGDRGPACPTLPTRLRTAPWHQPVPTGRRPTGGDVYLGVEIAMVDHPGQFDNALQLQLAPATTYVGGA